MLKFEGRMLEFIRKYIAWFLLICAVAVAVAMRCHFVFKESSDMRVYLIPWYNQFAEEGYSALYTTWANYNVAYMSLLFLATKIPLPPIVAIKLFSFAGDLLLAFAVALIFYRLFDRGPYKNLLTCLVFCGTLLLPSVVLNSGWWGQCDSIYAGFLVLAVWFALRDRWTFAFIAYGLSLCFKFQAIFLLPALIILYVCKRRFSILHFLLPPAMLFLSSAPLVVHDRDLLAGFRIYAEQAGLDGSYVNYHNLASIIGKRLDRSFNLPLILMALLVCLGLLVLVMVRKMDFTGDNLVLLAGWSIMTCVVLLPGMHERYAYAGEVLLLLWLALRPSARRLLPALTFYVLGFISCCRFLLGGNWPGQTLWLGLLNVVCYGYVTWLLVRAGLGQEPTRLGRHS